MKSISNPPKPHPRPPKRNKIRADVPSSSTPLQESDSLLIPIFPDELIIEILSRLPAKSVGKFKCVSRLWLFLISSKGFIKSHLAIASGRDGYGHQCLIFTVPTFQPRAYTLLKQCSVDSLLCEPTSEAVDIDYPVKPVDKSFWVVGSCHGLVCLHSGENYLCLWNPCIKEYKKLPCLRMKNDWERLGFGFGYDKLNDDYKVVVLFSILGDETFETKAKVYSLKNNCWHLTEDFKIYQIKGMGHYVSGKLHWVVCDDVGNQKIGSLDLANEKYQEMDKPKTEDSSFNWTVGVLGGCLSVLYDYQTTHHVDVWVMKEYGVKDSWTKVVSFPCFGDLGHFFCPSELVCLSRNDEVLLILSSVLSLYDPKRDTFRRYPQTLLDVNMYVESLVSPNAYNGERRQLRSRGKMLGEFSPV